jgi:hypothetical protein
MRRIRHTKQLLTFIADFFEMNNSRWTKGVGARNSKGREVDYDNPEATCFCSTGAIAHFGSDPAANSALVAIETILEKDNPDELIGIVGWNDSRRSVNTIVKVFRRAAQSL